MAIDKLKEYKLAQTNWERYIYAMSSGHANYQALAKQNENFYLGAGLQWDPEIKKLLELDGKPWLELNLIFSTLNAVIGTQTQSRMDIAYKPREDSDQEVADILTKIAMYILDRNNFSWKETDVFSDGLIQQRGYFDIRVEFDDNMQGEIVISVEDPLDVIPDPTANSYDPDDWADVIKIKWLSLDDIRVMYGDSAFRKVSRRLDSITTGNSLIHDYGVVKNSFSSEFANFTNYPWYYEDSAGTTYVKVIERQWWKLTNRKFFVDESGELIPVPDDLKKREINKIAKQNNYDVITKLDKRVRWTVSTKDILLFDEWSPYKHFTIVPFFPYFRRGATRGLVDNLIKTQELLNKVYSQILHTVNTTANSGWLVEEDSLANMTTEELEELGSRTGLVLEYKKGFNKPDKIEPNQIPTGLKDIVNNSIELIQMISGVSETFRGEKSNEVSGAAIQRRVAQTAVQLAVPIDNLFKTRNMIAKRLLELIQSFYTETRVFNIIGQPNEEPETIEINKVDETGRIINDVTVGKFDVVVADVPTQITFEQAQFQQALEMRKYGVAIPDDEMVLMSSLARKQEIAKKLNPEPSEEQVALQNKQLELQLKDLEAKIERMQADVRSRNAEAVRKATNVAKEIVENPSIGTILDKILEQGDILNTNKEENKNAEIQQEVPPKIGDLPPEVTNTIQ